MVVGDLVLVVIVGEFVLATMGSAVGREEGKRGRTGAG